MILAYQSRKDARDLHVLPMKTIAPARRRPSGGHVWSDSGSADPWRSIAQEAQAWCGAESVVWRDAVVLVPFVELLGPARRAFAAVGAWMPRIETTRTLARSLGPPTDAGTERGFDAALDTVLATQLLARQKWGAEWSRRDRPGFERAAARVAATAHELAQAAHAMPPMDRPDWWAMARGGLAGRAGPGARERVLAQVALEWAMLAPPPDTDRLFELSPSAWIVVEAGGCEPLADALVHRAGAPSLVIQTDAPLDAPFAAFAASAATPPAFGVCDGFEDEASAAAAQVLDHLGRDERPVALVAQDRVLVRRVRALLERAGVGLADETGWKLSTTRAGAEVMALLVAARPLAPADAFLAWLKTAPVGVQHRTKALAIIEAECRRMGTTRRDAIGGLDLKGAAADLRTRGLAILHELVAVDRRRLSAWLDALRAALGHCGSLDALRGDAAGRQALAALQLEPPLPPARRHLVDTDVDALSFAEFVSWVDAVFEGVTFRPPSPGGGGGEQTPDGAADMIDVVVTPLARATLRPFAAVVMPAADDQRLGAAPRDDSLLPRSLADDLGLPSARMRRDDELRAFAQALRCPRVTLLRRRGAATEPVAESPFVERLRLSLAAHGRDLRDWIDPRVERTLARAPVLRAPARAPAAALPQRLSASAFEALRACPYKFFARSVLRLGEAEELDDEIQKRDYGSWLHKVLHAFHVERAGTGAAGLDADAEAKRLLAIGDAARLEDDIDAAAFLPFGASFAVFVPRYIAWLHERERAGWAWLEGETEIVFAPAELEGIEMHGRIDRIDRRAGADATGPQVLELIDYKTGSASKLKELEAFEDTQLAFYAALVGSRGSAALRASYLALDGTRGIEPIAHDEVEASAAALVAGAARELGRIRAGEALPPLGEGSTCDFCEARGLCRRDHWSAAEVPVGALRADP